VAIILSVKTHLISHFSHRTFLIPASVFMASSLRRNHVIGKSMFIFSSLG